MLPVAQHALGWFSTRGRHFDALCLLQPTNPLRTAHDIDCCIELFDQSGADTVITVLPVPAEHNPHWVYFQSADGTLRLSTGESTPIPRRQELPLAFHRDGSVYVTRVGVVLDANTFYGSKTIGYPMSADRSVNIDDRHDWARAEALLAAADRRAEAHADR